MAKYIHIDEIPQLGQRQDSTSEQLSDLYQVAIRLGMYDAADWMRNNWDTNKIRFHLGEWIASPKPNDLVDPENGCPRCGERRSDSLIWQDDETIKCHNCGAVYTPPYSEEVE